MRNFTRLSPAIIQQIPTIALLAVLSCTPTIVTLKIDKNQLAASSLAVLPFYSCTINFPGSVDKILGKGANDSEIISFFEQAIAANLAKNSCFRSVSLCDRPAPAVVVDSVLDKNKYIEIWRPDGQVSCSGNVPDYILFVFNVAIDSATAERRDRDVDFTMTSLEFSAEYVYVKTEQRKIVTYGTINENYSSLFPVVDKKSFEKLAQKISEELLAEDNYSRRR
jgi:hypothetical protein